jgi:hypothetical protein
MFFGNIGTDQSKKLIGRLEYRNEKSGNNSGSNYEIEPSVTIRPIQTLRIRLSGNYSENRDRLQYVATKDYMSEKSYVLGKINQKTLGITFKVDFNLTPEFSIQYYGSPFVSKGSYSEFKHVTNPSANKYDERFAIFSNPVLNGGSYSLDENNDFLPDYYIDNPDFNFHQFRSNLVAKWEYRPGSFIYIVWSGERTGYTDKPGASIKESFRQLGKVVPENIFLIKLSYWFSL